MKIHVAVYSLITPNSLLIGYQHVNTKITSQSSGTSTMKIDILLLRNVGTPYQSINTIITITFACMHTQSHVHVCMCTLSVN